MCEALTASAHLSPPTFAREYNYEPGGWSGDTRWSFNAVKGHVFTFVLERPAIKDFRVPPRRGNEERVCGRSTGLRGCSRCLSGREEKYMEIIFEALDDSKNKKAYKRITEGKNK